MKEVYKKDRRKRRKAVRGGRKLNIEKKFAAFRSPSCPKFCDLRALASEILDLRALVSDDESLGAGIRDFEI